LKILRLRSSAALKSSLTISFIPEILKFETEDFIQQKKIYLIYLDVYAKMIPICSPEKAKSIHRKKCPKTDSLRARTNSLEEIQIIQHIPGPKSSYKYSVQAKGGSTEDSDIDETSCF